MGVPGQQVVPGRAPDDLDDVPARSPEDGLELLDDLAVAPHRTVEALQVAVHDEDQVVELLAGSQREGAQRLGLVGLAVAQETPHLGAGGVDDASVVQVPVEAGLVDGVDGTDAHRHRGELPEVGHEPRVGIRGQASAPQLHAEVVQLVLAEAPLEEGSGVDARGGVALEVHLVAASLVLAPEEVVEADLVEAGRAGVGGQVAADAVGDGVGPGDHHRRVPSDVGPDAPLHVLVTREPRLLLGRDGVDVRSGDRGREAHLLLPGPVQELHEEELGAGLAQVLDHGVEGVHPLARLLRVDVGEMVGEAVDDQRVHGFLCSHLAPAPRATGQSRRSRRRSGGRAMTARPPRMTMGRSMRMGLAAMASSRPWRSALSRPSSA